MNIRNLLALVTAIPLIMILGMVSLIVQIDEINQQIKESEERTYISYQLADELRQSSDDLTRMVRTYSVTGEPMYKEYFHKILDIRSGVAPRPEGYSGIFWDYVIPGNKWLDQVNTGDPVALQVLMKQAGFTEEELEKLAAAEAKSNLLAKQEILAMAAMEGRYPDEHGELIISGKPDKELAQQLLHNLNYHRIKAEIMVPLDHFMMMVKARASNEIDQKRTQQSRLITLLWALMAGLFITLVVSLSVSVLRKRHSRTAVSNSNMYTAYGINRYVISGVGLFLLVVSAGAWLAIEDTEEYERKQIGNQLQTCT